ncbi:hypothetical protein ACU4GR_01575 [Methylobacterium oryzae CBMB20]
MNTSVRGPAHRRPVVEVRSLSHAGFRRDAFFGRSHRIGQLKESDHHEQNSAYAEYNVNSFSDYFRVLSLRCHNDVSDQRKNGDSKRWDHIVCLTHDALRTKKLKLLQIGGSIFDDSQKWNRRSHRRKAGSLFAGLAPGAAP